MSLVWESVTYLLGICGKVQDLCVLETDCRASVRTGAAMTGFFDSLRGRRMPSLVSVFPPEEVS